MEQCHRWTVEIFDSSGARVGEEPIVVDFEPAAEWARFDALRHGALAAAGHDVRTTVRPIWHRELRAPYAAGFRVGVTVGGSRVATTRFPATYFTKPALAASARLVAGGQLQRGDGFRYAVKAHAVRDRARPRPGARPRVERLDPALELEPAPLAPLLERSTALGAVEPGELPVFIPRRVLDEASAAARAAGAVESGGVLVGQICQEVGRPKIFARVDAQIPAASALGDRASLSFTAEAWAEVRGELARRNRGEIFLGWWHSHLPYAWSCKNCPLERRRSCPLARDFFSEQDEALHRTVFPRAYSVALVVNRIAEDEAIYSLFGWRKGMLEPRGFQVLDPTASPPAARPVGPAPAVPEH